MILTVTLNAAIDRTVAVPNFRLGQRHRAVESRTVAGGKGVNVARALKLLGEPGDRHRPRRRRDRAADPRAPRATESILTTSPRSRATRAPTSPSSTRPPASRPRSTSAAPRSIRRARSTASSRSCSTSPRARRSACSPGSIPPGAPTDVYARLIAELRALGVLTRARHRRRADARRPARRARRGRPERGEAEEAVGHEFNDADDFALGLARPARDGRGGGDHHHGVRLRRDRRRAAPSAAATRRGSSRSSRSPRSAPATASWPATSPPATRAPRRATASPSGSPAAPSRPSTSAPARSTGARSSGCSAGSRSASSTSRPACALSRPRPRLTAVIIAGPRAMRGRAGRK